MCYGACIECGCARSECECTDTTHKPPKINKPKQKEEYTGYKMEAPSVHNDVPVFPSPFYCFTDR